MRVLGINDEVTTCSCCGKTNLKKTVVLETEAGEELRYGTDCAAKALLGSKSAKNNRVISVRAQAAELARKWLKAGHKPEVVAKGIWNRFGFCTSVKGNGVDIDTVGVVAA